MKKKSFRLHIAAPRSVVWQTLWGKESYNEWTRAFSEGSTVETDWKEGSPVLFGDGKGNGMVSRIVANRLNEFMSFEHLDEMKDGKKLGNVTWSGALENYTLSDADGGTQLTVEMDVDEKYEEYFDSTFPKALDKVREMSEATHHPAGH